MSKIHGINRQIEIRSDADTRAENKDHSGLRLNIHHYAADDPTFVLIHGLSSNARTWDQVASHLADAGQTVISVDQRGHGLSDKPDGGYDFATVAEDLHLLMKALGLNQPILAGQSWGGNVALAFGAIYPEAVRGLAFIDGGYLDLQMRPNATWEQIEKELRPPKLAGTPYMVMKERLRSFHPEWEEVGIEGTLANFEVLPDETVRPWLTLPRHMMILRSLWEQRPSEFYPKVTVPVLICAADNGSNSARLKVKKAQIDAATSALLTSQTQWFPETDHDIHVHRPKQLAELFLDTLQSGIWS
ncbi:MAG: alpha/beta hydrolase [Chloroflexota bacterium]